MVGNSGHGRSTGLFGRTHAAQVPEYVPDTPVANFAQCKEYDRASLPQLTDDQWIAVVKFLNTLRSEPADKLNGKTYKAKFIIDTGASHHMTWNLDILSNVFNIVPCSIGLPDGDSALATKQGDLCLGGDLWIHGVLYSAQLDCDLIYVAKLLKVTKGSTTFTEDLCVFASLNTTETL